jgi:PhnB protein
MVSDGGGVRETMPAFLYVYVEDADTTYRHAIGLGARLNEEPVDTPYGDQRATIQDPWGDICQIATHKGGAETDTAGLTLAQILPAPS